MTKVMRYENGKAITGQVDAPFKVDWSEWQTMTDAQKKGKKWLIENVPGAEGEIDADLLVPLWTNPSPTSSFAAQNITLTSGDYDFLIITSVIDCETYAKGTFGGIYEKGKNSILFYAKADERWIISRGITYNSDTSLSIGNAYYYYIPNSSNPGVANNVCVPLAIYGIKKTVKIKFDALAKDVSTLASKCMLDDGETSVEDVIGKGKISVTADGVKTYKQLLLDLWALIDLSKVDGRTILNIGNYSTEMDTLINIKFGPSRVDFSQTMNNGTVVTNYYVHIDSSNAIYRKAGESSVDFSNTVASSGTKIILTY